MLEHLLAQLLSLTAPMLASALSLQDDFFMPEHLLAQLLSLTAPMLASALSLQELLHLLAQSPSLIAAGLAASLQHSPSALPLQQPSISAHAAASQLEPHSAMAAGATSWLDEQPTTSIRQQAARIVERSFIGL